MDIIRLCAGIINVAAVIAVAGTALADFYNNTGRHDAVTTKKTPVSAVTIVVFIAVFCVVLLLGIGALPLNTVCIVLGAVISAFGAVFQIIGRIQLGRSWSNQIKIYEHHTLVTTGVYSVIRHPLYATFIVMFFGNALMYSNWLAALLTAAVFVPMMDFRARQEEKILSETFDGYAEYMKTTGRLFAKFSGGGTTAPVSPTGDSTVAVKEKVSTSPLRVPQFWIVYVVAVGIWAAGLRLPGYLILIPLVGITPYLMVGVLIWMLLRNRYKPEAFGFMLGTLTPFMASFAIISIRLLLDIPLF